MFLSLLIYFEGERENKQGKTREREEVRENSKHAPYGQQGAQHGAQAHELRDHALNLNQEQDA